MKEKYYINEKTHLATEKYFVLQHSLKVNKRGAPGKNGGGGGGRRVRKNRKINKRPPSFIRHLRVQSDESFNNNLLQGGVGVKN